MNAQVAVTAFSTRPPRSIALDRALSVGSRPALQPSGARSVGFCSSSFAGQRPSRILRRASCRHLSTGTAPGQVFAAVKQKFSSFEELILGSDKPLLIDFYATWCGPCQMMTPVLAEVNDRLRDQIQVVKIDTEKYPAIASRYKVTALPTLILFQGGHPVNRLEGALEANDLVRWVQSSLASGGRK